MNFLVIGSRGQIGSALCKYLRDRGHSVVELDIIDGNDAAKSTIFNKKVLENIDYIFFLAFDVGGSHYLETYQHTFTFIHNNISLMKNVFEVLKETDKPFLFASSQMSNMSHSTYGIAKRIGELYCNTLDSVVVKFWNVYGVEQDPNKFHVITDFIFKAKKGCINMLTTGQESRQFLYVDDCCDALLTIALNHSILDKTKNYHITSFEWTKIIDIAKIIQDKIKCDIIPGRVIDTVQLDVKNNPDEYILKLWSPKTTIYDGIDQIIKQLDL